MTHKGYVNGCSESTAGHRVLCHSCAWALPKEVREAINGSISWAHRHGRDVWKSLTVVECAADALDYVAAIRGVEADPIFRTIYGRLMVQRDARVSS